MDQVYSQTSIVEYKTKADEAQAVQKSAQKHNFTHYRVIKRKLQNNTYTVKRTMPKVQQLIQY